MSQVIILSDVTLGRVTETVRYLGPYTLVSKLRAQGFSAQVLDYFTRLDNLEEYLKLMISPETLVLGISSTFLTPDSDDVLTRERTEELHNNPYLWKSSSLELEKELSIINSLKIKYGFKIIIGGAKTLACVHEFNNNPHGPYKYVDYYSLGRADDEFLQLVKDLSLNKKPQTYKIESATLLDSLASTQKVTQIESFKFSKLDAIQRNEGLPIETSQGCNFNCKFCHWKKRSSIYKSSSQLRDEFRYNYEMFGTHIYQFCDDCINDSVAKVNEIVNSIASLNFKIDWISFARVDLAIKRPDTFTAMIDSGAVGLHFGLESFNKKAAAAAGKPQDPECVKDWLINAYNKYSSQTLFQGSFIVGLPGETQQSQKETCDWLLKHKPLDFASFGGLTLWKYESFVDKKVIDYAEYSRRPEFYGFKSVSFSPEYWEHDTMNSNDANHLASLGKRNWIEQGNNTAIHSIWLYPRLRSLGLTKSDIFKMSRDETIKNKAEKKIDELNAKFVDNYHSDLISVTAYGEKYNGTTKIY